MKIPESIYNITTSSSSNNIDEFDQFNILKDMLTNKKNSKLKKSTSMPFKQYTKSLTARLNDISTCDGNTEWSRIANEHDLYNQQIKCIGTNPADFEMGDPVSIDLQPLSTKFEIMCKLVVIDQGPNKERQTQILSIEPVKQMISINRIKTDSNEDNNNNNCNKKDEFVDTYTYSHELKHLESSIKTSFISKKITKNNDSKEYFNYKVEKKTPKSEIDNKNTIVKSASTCTDDLLDGKSIGGFSKYQLLSSDSLHNKETSLVHSKSAYDDIRYIDEEINENDSNGVDLLERLNEIPITINIKNKIENCQQNNSNVNNNNNNDSITEETEINIKIPTGPQKSHEWSLFKKQEANTIIPSKPIYYKSFTQSIVNKTESKISQIVTQS